MNVSPPVAPPSGSATVTCAVPDRAMRSAGTVAVSEVAETKVVASAVPFHFTVAPLTKFVPVAVRVNDGRLGAMLLGESWARVIAVARVTVNVAGREAPPLGSGLIDEHAERASVEKEWGGDGGVE